MYRMGMEHYYDPYTALFLDLEREILNWKFVEHSNWYTSEKRDAVFRVVKEPKCLKTFGERSERIWGPGLFFDWLNVRSFQEWPIQENAWLYAAHVNSYYFRGPALANIVQTPPSGDPKFISLGAQFEPDLWHLASLPGYKGVETDCLSLEVGCANDQSIIVSDYEGCWGTSLDLNRGSSGGAVFTAWSGHIHGIQPKLMGSAWGVVHGGRQSANQTNYWGLYDDWPDGPNAPEYPTATDQTIFTAFSDAMATTVRNTNQTQQPATGPTPTDLLTRPEITDSTDFSLCEGDCSSTDCVGDCSKAYKGAKLRCTNLYDAEFGLPGLGIGVTGGLKWLTEGPVIGDLGLVCSPWSSWSWTNFWNSVGHVSDAVQDLLFDYGGGAGRRVSNERPFSTSLITDSMDHIVVSPPYEPLDETQRQRPFQMCPPGHHLAGILFSVDSGDTVSGVQSIECRLNYDSSQLAKIYLHAPHADERLTIETWIGSPHLSPDVRLTCEHPTLSMAISGLEVFRDSNDNVKGVRAYCTNAPLPLPSSNECNLPTPAGAPPVGVTP